MLKLRKIAVTGGLSSGKTSVCHIFEKLGAYTVSADEIVHRLLSLNSEVGQQVVGVLGTDIIEGKEISRSQVASKVFSQPSKLEALENILHPAVIQEIERQYQKVKENRDYSFFVAEVPLVYEAEAADLFDYILCVVTKPHFAKQRFINQTGYSESEYERRMNCQMPPEKKAAQADFVIVNNGDYQELTNQVYLLLKELPSQ